MKREKADKSGGVRKRSRPPLLSELRELRAAEEDSSLARLEVTELLARARDAEAGSAATREALFRLRRLLLEPGDRNVNAAEAAAVFPSYRFARADASLAFVPPRAVEAAGALLCDTVTRKRRRYDLVAVLPAQCLQSKDRQQPWHYHDKRVLFLAELALRLRRGWPELEVAACDEAFGGDPRKPVLAVRVPQLPGATVRFFCGYPAGANKLPLSKLLPQSGESALRFCSIAEDSQILSHAAALRGCAERCAGAAEALLLAREWRSAAAAAAERSSGPFFSSFHCGMLLAVLVERGTVAPLAHALAAFRLLLLALADPQTFAGGLFWPSPSPPPELLRKRFAAAFDVVFVDASGVVNLTARLSAAALAEAQRDARAALEAMDSQSLGALFAPQPPFALRWDLVVTLPLPLPPANDSRADVAEYLGSDEATLRKICELLRRGLGTRCVAAGHRLGAREARVGVLLDSANAFRKLDAGPPAEDKERAAQFRQFWGARAELRRFRDGSVVEAVVWEGPFEERRRIPERVIAHLLELHLGIVSHTVLGCQVEALLPRSGDAAALHIVNVFGDLSQKIRALDRVPLPVADVWGLDPTLRCCGVFPPPENPFADGAAVAGNSRQSLAIPALEFGVRYTSSSAWPSEAAAMVQLKHAFRLKTRQELARVFGIASVLQEDCLDVLYRGFVFRMRLFSGKESAEAKRAMQVRAAHSTAVLGLHLRHNAFGATARLCKRWLAAHLLSSDRVPEELVELTAAAVFFAEAVPALPQAGFLRWLRLLAAHPWDAEPLLVTLSQEHSAAASAFSASSVAAAREVLARRGAGPVVVSEHDASSFWTRNLPTAAVWRRVTALAAAAAAAAERGEAPASLFVPNYAEYDLVIQLRGEAVPNHWQNVSRAFAPGFESFSPSVPAAKDLPWTIVARKCRRDNSELLIGFAPVRELVAALNERFQLLAHFFWDEYGGDRIGVALRRARVAAPFPAASLNSLVCARPAAQADLIEFSREQFDAAIRSLGGDMIASIQSK